MKTLIPHSGSAASESGEDGLSIPIPATIPEPAKELLFHRPTILVAIDFSPPAFNALATAIAVAGAMNARLVVLHVEEHISLGLLGRRSLEYLDDHRKRHHANRNRIRRVMGASLEELSGDGARDVLIISVDGDPATEIVKTAFDLGADLIVVASHGRTGITRALLGSTAERVVRHATCPVLLARRKKAVLNLPPPASGSGR